MKLKKILILFVAASSFNALADSVRTSDGVSCSFDANSNPYEVSADIGKTNDDAEYWQRGAMGSRADSSDEMEYGLTFTYKFGSPKQLDCNKLYQIELKEKTLRTKLLEKKLELMEAGAKINWNESD